MDAPAPSGRQQLTRGDGVIGRDEPSGGNDTLRAAQQALRDSEAINRAIVESIPQKLFLKDCGSVYLAVNQALAASLGCTPEQVVGKDDFALVPAKLAEKYRADDRAVIESGQAKHVEERYVAQGKEYWIHTVKTPVRNLAGDVIAVLGLFEDITEQKRAAHALEASEKRYRRLFESAKDGILILDADSGCIVDANPFLERLTGYSHEELLGRCLWEIGAFKDIAASREAFATLQTEKYVRYEHLPLKARDGHRIDVEFVSNVYRVDGQDVIQCNIRDITAWKRAEIERNRLARAIEQIAEMVVVTNARGDIVYANPAFEAVTGYAHQEVLGQSPRLLKSGVQDEAFYRALWATISGGGTWHGRMVNKKKDGTLYTAEATISPVRDAAGAITSYVAVERDISARLVLEAQFLQAQRMESIGRLAGGVAHDFNNLVTVILSYTALALEQLRDGDPLKDDLLEVTGAGERAAALTRQLLAFGRKQVLQPVALDLNQVLGDMENMLRRIIGEDIELVWAPESALGVIRADPGQLEQVLMNLVVNARDAMPDGGRLTIETSNVEIDEAYVALHVAVRPGPYVVLSVSDTGSGMDEATRTHIFDPFFTTKDKGKGTGLGLSTVQGIVAQSGGNIWVYSEPGQGTTFKVYLPRELEASMVPASERLPTPVRTGTETILVVEDEGALRRVARRILGAAGYTVLTASGGAEAISLCAQHDVDLLLTDMVMPSMSGTELAQKLADTRPSLRVLYTSGYSDEGLVNQGVLEPGVHFLPKPFTAADLVRKVREVLDCTSPLARRLL